MNAYELLRDLHEKLAVISKPPDVYLMNWSTWCKMRRALKREGISITYLYLGNHHWRRYIGGTIVQLHESVKSDEVYSLVLPKPTLSAPIDPFPELKMTRDFILRYHLFDI